MDALRPEDLLPSLAQLQQGVCASVEDAASIQKMNSSFDPNDDTVSVLIAACQKLLDAKAAMEETNFEEHSAELSYLCKRFGTSLDRGLSDAAYREKLATSRAAHDKRPSGRKREGRIFFAVCCHVGFPPQQRWWVDIHKRLVPKFKALRAGRVVDTLAADVVAGDIVFLCEGQKAVADVRVIAASEKTEVDLSHLTGFGNDMRAVAIMATAAAAIDSANIVLKDGFIIRGSLFAMVVRDPSNPLLPSSGSDGDSTDEFEVDAAPPPGMSVSACQSLFKALCTKAHLACRSFSVLGQLGEVKTLVVTLTKELLDKGTVPKFCMAARKLGKTAVLVNIDCSTSAISSLCQELSIKHVDLEQSIGARSPYSGGPGSSATSPVMNEAEKQQIDSLVAELSSTKAGALVSGMSQDGLLRFCKKLHREDSKLLYAMTGFHYPRCFRGLVSVSPRQRRPVPNAPNSLEASRSCSVNGTDRLEASTTINGTAINGTLANTPTLRNNPPMEACDSSEVGQERNGELVLSLNSIGIVSDFADCVLLKSDLGYLGQALEIVSKNQR